MSTNYKMWAPKCAYPTCNNKVGYHKRYPKLDKTMGFKWKIACEDHRKVKKWEFDAWKVAVGCENADTRYGFKCTSTITGPEQIDVHHVDGNKHNSDPSNLERLCRNCHGRVTLENGDHRNRYTNAVTLNPDLFEVA